MNVKTHVYLRADGNSRIGLGHVHRLLALGEILQGHFECKFIIRSPLPGIREMMLQRAIQIIELDEKLPFEKEPEHLLQFLTGIDIIVLDGYQFDTTYQQGLKKNGTRLVCVDDIHLYHFVSDFVINPSGGVGQSLYTLSPSTCLLTGPAYAFLKGPFRERKKRNITVGQLQETGLLICLGGADPQDNTRAVLEQMLTHSFRSFSVIVGEAYPHFASLHDFIKGCGKEVRVFKNLAPSDLAQLMETCHMAITSASGIAYEYLAVGGELYIKQTADNQELMFRYLVESGLAFPLEQLRADSPKIELSMERQRSVFDGGSGQRLLRIFFQLEFVSNLSIRRAARADLMTFFNWANDPQLRSQSYNSSSISLETHTQWFEKKITDPNCLLYIFEFKNSPVAQVRFDLKHEAIISYSMDKDYRGKGFGQIVLNEAMKRFRQDFPQPLLIVGYVKKENESSNRIFDNLGFTKKDTSEYPNSYRYEYIV